MQLQTPLQRSRVSPMPGLLHERCEGRARTLRARAAHRSSSTAGGAGRGSGGAPAARMDSRSLKHAGKPNQQRGTGD